MTPDSARVVTIIVLTSILKLEHPFYKCYVRGPTKQPPPVHTENRLPPCEDPFAWTVRVSADAVAYRSLPRSGPTKSALEDGKQSINNNDFAGEP